MNRFSGRRKRPIRGRWSLRFTWVASWERRIILRKLRALISAHPEDAIQIVAGLEGWLVQRGKLPVGE